MKDHQKEFLAQHGTHEVASGLTKDKRGLLGLAKRPDIEPDIEAAVIDSKDHMAMTRLSRNKSLSAKGIDAFVNSPSVEDQVAIAKSPHLSKEQQETLSFGHTLVSYELAKNPYLHPEVYEDLSRHPNWEVKAALSENPSLHRSLISDMWKQSEGAKGQNIIRSRLGQHPNAPEEVKFAYERSQGVHDE